jgi:hypothetical protein
VKIKKHKKCASQGNNRKKIEIEEGQTKFKALLDDRKGPTNFTVIE